MYESTQQLVEGILKNRYFHMGTFKYYVIKEVGGWGGQMMMFDDKVGGLGVTKC